MKDEGRRNSGGLALAFDVGTSSLRTALFDTDGRRVPGATAQAEYKLNYTADGGAELSAPRLRNAARQCLKQTLDAYREKAALRRRPILGIGMSCFWHSLLGIGADGSVRTPIYTWADSRCRTDAAALRSQFDERKVHARTGCMLRSSFWPAKLVWLRRTDARLFASVRQWLSPADWLCRQFGGPAGCGWSMASGTGLLDIAAMRWDEEMLAACHVRGSDLGALDETPGDGGRIGRAFPELKGVPWYPAIGDGAASNLGSGATRPGYAAINVGTSAALRLMSEGKPGAAPFGLFCLRVDAKRHLVGGAVSNAGSLRAWCMRELRIAEDRVERELARRPRPDHGLVVLPFWTAERAPDWEEEKRGTIIGITHHTVALDILQAATEASYYRIARIAGLILERAPAPPKFIVSGGIQRSRSSIQRLANILNQPLYPNDEPEASLRGAAIYGLERLGLTAPASRLGGAIHPQARFVEAYAKASQAAEGYGQK